MNILNIRILYPVALHIPTMVTLPNSNPSKHIQPNTISPLVDLNAPSSAAGISPQSGHTFIDPMRPPIVKLTEISANGDGRYRLARFRENEIYTKTRFYLSYFHDKSTTTCLGNMTKLSLTMFLRSNGLPSDPIELRKLFLTFHSKYEGIEPKDVEADLHSLKNYLNSRRTHHLATTQNSFNSYYLPHSKSNKNFH